jgi:hypothetical protein
MKKLSLAIIFLLLGGMIMPAMAGDVGRYSYINVHSVNINLENEKATIDIFYTVDDGIRFLVLLLGKSDMKNKLLMVADFENANFQSVDLDHAVLVINNASNDNGDGSYWFPEHKFGIVIPKLVVKTPQVTRTFLVTDEFPNGIGHFKAS